MKREDELVGTDFRGCRVVQHLGSGGMGTVFLARHRTLNKDVAIKFLSDELSQNEQAVARFLREARTLAQLEDEPNIVKVYDCGVEAGRFFIMLQYVPGSDLEEYVKRRGGILPSKEAVDVVLEALHGLKAAHALGVIHRDIKPANLMISDRGQVKLTDFGLVKPVKGADVRVTSTGQVMGTPLFMSPEQWAGQPVDARTDLYSLGVTLYRIISGHLPYEGDNVHELHARVLVGKYPSLESYEPGIDRRLSVVVAKMMSKSPDLRPADADTAAEALRPFGTHAPVEAAAPAGQARPPTRRATAPATAATAPVLRARKRPAPSAAVAIAIVGLVVAAGAAFLVFRDRGQNPGSAGSALSKIQLTVRPRRASVSLDGRALPASKDGVYLVDATSGPHSVRVSLRGFSDSEQTLQVSAGQPAKALIQLDVPGMVWIPAGRLRRGLKPDEVSLLSGQIVTDPELKRQVVDLLLKYTPQEVDVPGYYIDRFEASNSDYRKFLEATGRSAPEGWTGTSPPRGKERHPVAGVTWEDAHAYAEWIGKRLVREVEWERAVRGENSTYYPWGNRFEKERCNTGEGTEQGTVPVDAYENGRTATGIYNLVGNVSEWIDEAQDAAKSKRLVKGGSVVDLGAMWGLFCTNKFGVADITRPDMGFRCAMDGE